MSFRTKVRDLIKKRILGKTLLPQEFTLGLPEPQTEITVSLRSPSGSRDVTTRLSTACAEPLTICIGFDEGTCPSGKDLSDLTLVFSERNGRQRVLGEIGLDFKQTLAGTRSEFMLFEPLSSRNFCLSKAHLGLHYLLHAYRQWKRDNTQGIQMSFLERRASMVTFIRPHPIFLVSVGNYEDGNLFPMNLCGYLGNGHFGFALRTERVAGTLVRKAGRVALSSVPEMQGSTAYRLADQHKKESIDWSRLPFATRSSKVLGIPVPEFAQRVKELEISNSIAVGSHRFFIAQILEEEVLSDELGFCSIHGFYQFWRLKELKQFETELARSLAGDAFHKRERHPRIVPENNRTSKGTIR
jgi:flavin reductase (DIM6/NTAB) family NADH-FMN oxidoreductase RutF